MLSLACDTILNIPPVSYTHLDEKKKKAKTRLKFEKEIKPQSDIYHRSPVKNAADMAGMTVLNKDVYKRQLLTMRAMDENGKWLPKSRKVYDLDENGERIRLPRCV